MESMANCMECKDCKKKCKYRWSKNWVVTYEKCELDGNITKKKAEFKFMELDNMLKLVKRLKGCDHIKNVRTFSRKFFRRYEEFSCDKLVWMVED